MTCSTPPNKLPSASFYLLRIFFTHSDVIFHTSPGSLKGKTRLLVTNQLQYLPQADLVIYLEDGRVAEQGSYQEVLKNASFASLLTSLGQSPTRELQCSFTSEILRYVTNPSASFLSGLVSPTPTSI